MTPFIVRTFASESTANEKNSSEEATQVIVESSGEIKYLTVVDLPGGTDIAEVIKLKERPASTSTSQEAELPFGSLAFKTVLPGFLP